MVGALSAELLLLDGARHALGCCLLQTGKGVDLLGLCGLGQLAQRGGEGVHSRTGRG